MKLIFAYIIARVLGGDLGLSILFVEFTALTWERYIQPNPA
jgi:hypothetical protein